MLSIKALQRCKAFFFGRFDAGYWTLSNIQWCCSQAQPGGEGFLSERSGAVLAPV